MRHRIITLIVLTGAVAYAPWWLSALLALGAVWRFDSGYELLGLAALVDLAYGTPNSQLFGFAFSATGLIALTDALSQVLARRLFLQS